MTRRRSRPFARAVLGAASVLLLAGCTAAPILTPVATSPSPSPNASEPFVEGVDAPVPLLDISCADLITEEELYAALGVTVSLAPADESFFGERTDPASFALESFGGIACDWTNGQPQYLETDEGFVTNPTFARVGVRVMPDAVDEWRLFAEKYSAPIDRDFACYDISEVGGPLGCAADVLQGTNWVELEFSGSPVAPDTDIESTTATVRAMWDAALGRIAAAPPAAQVYVPPADVIPLDLACDQYVTREQAQRLLGLTAPPYLSPPEGGAPYFDESVSQRAMAQFCYWTGEDGSGVGISNSFLLGGEWAFQRLREETPANYDEVDIAGLGFDDSAYIDCARSDECVLHVIIGHNWITYERVQADAPGAVPVDRRVLLRLGELTAATLRG